jgi:hypothetical protein
MGHGLDEVRRRLDDVTGADRTLDGAIADALGRPVPAPDYTASVDRCIDLIHACLPGWAWHVGWNASGVLPYATLHGDGQLVAANAPTVPLALLKALVSGLRARDGTG